MVYGIVSVFMVYLACMKFGEFNKLFYIWVSVLKVFIFIYICSVFCNVFD